MPILTRVVNLCWFCFKWGLALAVVTGGAAALHFYHRIDDTIRRQVESKIARHYARLKVGVHSAQRVEGKGIRLEGVTIVEPGADGPDPELLSIDGAFPRVLDRLEGLGRRRAGRAPRDSARAQAPRHAPAGWHLQHREAAADAALRHALTGGDYREWDRRESSIRSNIRPRR